MKVPSFSHLPFRGMITGCRYLKEPADRELVISWMDHLRERAKFAFKCTDEWTMWGVGDCPTGPDEYAWEYLKEHKLPHERFEADWDRYGMKYAGPTRNNLMIATIRPTHTLAFMHPRAKGTVGCSDRAQPMSRVYRIYSKDFYTSTAAGQPPPPPFDWSRLNEAL